MSATNFINILQNPSEVLQLPFVNKAIATKIVEVEGKEVHQIAVFADAIEGAATSDLQSEGNAILSNIDAALGEIDAKDFATSALQTTGNANLSTIAGKDFATSALQTAGNATLSSLDGKFSSLGQKISASSVPVVLSSDQSPVTVSGPITNAQLRATNVPINLGDSANLDAFGRLRVAPPSVVFAITQTIDGKPLEWDDAVVSGSGTSSTYNTNQASTTIAVSNLTAGMRARQTKRWHYYRPDGSQLILMTFVLGAGATGITKRVGLFQTNNGIYLQLAGTAISFVIRTFTSGSVVNTVIAQSSWNVDKLDGTGASGINLDVTKAQILAIDFEWLGVGRIRFGFVIDGKLYYCHYVNNANSISTVYMSNPHLPCRYEISNDGTGAAASLVTICASVMFEGNLELTGRTFSVDRGITPLVTLNNTAIYPLIALRLASTGLHATVQPSSLNIITTSTAVFRVCVLVNPTVVGTALSFSAVTNSAVEAAVGALNATTVTGGTQIFSEYFDAGASNSLALNFGGLDVALGSTIAGVSDVLVMAVQVVAGTTETFYGSLQYKELS